MRIHERIADKALALGFHQVGFHPVEVFEELREIYEKRKFLEFEVKDPQRRIDPRSHFPEGKTFVALGMGYPLYRMPKLKGDEVRVAASQVPDYHRVVREGLEKLLHFIREELGGEGRSFVDVEGLDDRYVARLCGLGYYGRHTQIISPYLGSTFNIGYLIINLDLGDPTPAVEGDCGGCTRCLDACPTGAIRGDYTLDAGLCLSYLTQKKDLRESEAALLNRCIYGCDLCLRACPHNLIQGGSPDHVFVRGDFESLSQRQYKKIYAHRDFSFRGVKILRRNIALAMENSHKINQ